MKDTKDYGFRKINEDGDILSERTKRVYSVGELMTKDGKKSFDITVLIDNGVDSEDYNGFSGEIVDWCWGEIEESLIYDLIEEYERTNKFKTVK